MDSIFGISLFCPMASHQPDRVAPKFYRLIAGRIANWTTALLDLQRSRTKFALGRLLLEAGQLTGDDRKKAAKSMRSSPGLH